MDRYRKSGIYNKKINSGKFEKYFLSEDVLQNSVNAITGDNESVWVATLGGIFTIHPGDNTVQHYSSNHGLPHNNIKQIFRDTKNQIWAVCYGKDICCFRNNKMMKFRVSSINDILDITSVTEDKNGNIWIATYGNGIFKIDSASSVNFSTEQGIFSDYCYSIIADDKGFIWIGHRAGLSQINTDDFSVNTFSKKNGIINEFNYNAVFKDKTGNIWFGTSSGIIKYDPAKNKKNLVPPALNITSVKFSDKEVDFTHDIICPYDAYKLKIEFMGISYKNPSKVTYQYKMEGYDLGWSEFSTDNIVQYNRIEDGNFTFFVNACNSDGICTDKPLELKIRIEAPFWKRWWFLTITLVTICMSIYLFSDGFADQFGGTHGKKFKYKPFKEILLKNCEKSMWEQQTILNNEFSSWRQCINPNTNEYYEQIDDITVVGIKI
ncbi:MAG: hypothetical protein HY738_23810 [Bacteroidia bacterium]|nr:hypothetical protein [Bacteroidia bacterium]